MLLTKLVAEVQPVNVERPSWWRFLLAMYAVSCWLWGSRHDCPCGQTTDELQEGFGGVKGHRHHERLWRSGRPMTSEHPMWCHNQADYFMKVMHGQKEPFHHLINAPLADRVALNRQRLRLVSIVKTFVVMWQTEADPSVNLQGFAWVLDWCWWCDLAYHLDTALCNAIYTYATTQNKLINIIGD